MKTLTIRDDVYEKLDRLKLEGESFSDVIQRLLEEKRPPLEEFLGVLKDSEWLDELETEVLERRRLSRPRV